MRLAAAVTAASIAWTGCSVAEPARLRSGQSVSLSVGDSTQIGETTLRIGFEGVTSDSRCPKGEQCIRAGEATVRVWSQRGTGQRQTIELKRAPGAGASFQLEAQRIGLVRLEPYPVTGRRIAPEDYVATFALGTAAVGDPEK